MSKIRFQIVLAVWGERYRDSFLRVSLPTLMTTGNLLGFAGHDAVFDIYTTPEDGEIIAADDAVRVLGSFMEVRINRLRLDDSDERYARPDGKYHKMIDVHGMAITRKDEPDSAMSFIGPKTVCSDGLFDTVRQRTLEGYRAVLIPGVRTGAAFVASYQQRFNPYGRIAVALPPRAMADLVLRHPFEGAHRMTWGSPTFGRSPSHIYFPVEPAGMIVHAFHQHPIVIRPKRRVHNSNSTVDGTYVSETVGLSDIYMTTDSDEGFAVDAGSDPNAYDGMETIEHDPHGEVAAFVFQQTNIVQRHFGRTPFRLHRTDIDAEWLAAERQAGATLDRVFDLIGDPLASIRLWR